MILMKLVNGYRIFICVWENNGDYLLQEQLIRENATVNKIKRSSSKLILGLMIGLISISMLIITSLLFLYVTESDNSYYSHFFVVSTFISVFAIWNRWFSKSIVDPINLLLMAQFIFLGSNSILKILTLDSHDYFAGYPLNDKDYILTNSLIITGILFFIFGAIVASMSQKKLIICKNNKFIKNKYFIESGIVLFIIGITALIIDFDSSIV